MNLGVIFLTGLTVGGLTCLAVQGGLLASLIAAKEEDNQETGTESGTNSTIPTLAFLGAKLVTYTFLGFLLGAFGGAVGINQSVQIGMQFAAGLYMIAIALNLLNVHPIFRYVVIQPPRFLTRLVKNQSKSKDVFAPALLGAMTIFIPCGTTLAMETLAISSASGVMGASIMAAFILGTSPLFFGVGWLTNILGNNFRTNFLYLAGAAVLYLGLTSVNGALVASGSSITISSLIDNTLSVITLNNTSPYTAELSDTQVTELKNGVQNVEIAVTSRGYVPSVATVKNGQPVQLTLKSIDAYSCASAFRIPSLGISKNLQPNEMVTLEFTPQTPGKIPFTCSMGMYRGVINVI